jgi:hypothetical protein
MSPEQLRGAIADRRSDVFAIGLLLYELATGTNPFRRSSVFETAEAILSPVPVPWPRASDVPKHFRRVVSKALSKAAAERYESACEMHSELASDSSPAVAFRLPRRTGAFVAATLAVALLAFSAWFSLRPKPAATPPPKIIDTQLTFTGDVKGVALSPDGRTAAYGTGSGGRVFVRDIAGGQSIEIWRGEIVVEFQWTRDGSNVVVSGIKDDRLGLWLVPRLGGSARNLNVKGAHFTISPDGRSIARAMQNSQGFKIAPLDGGPETDIKLDGFRWLLGLDWGVASNRIAVLTQADDGSRTIWTLAPDGSDTRRLLTARNLASVGRRRPTSYASRTRRAGRCHRPRTVPPVRNRSPLSLASCG